MVKLNSVFAAARNRYGLAKDDLIETVVHAVGQRDPSAQRPVYLSNLGGCGSHWISRMMSQAAGLVDVGEVYVPVPWYASMLKLPLDVAARVLDGIELVHGLLYNGEPGGFSGARTINSAHGYEKIAFHRALRPRAKVIHLIRDPRDRTMSVSFRKDEFRNYEAAGVGDHEYFLSKAVRSLSAWRKYDSLKEKADIEVRYEEFRANAADQLQVVLEALDAAPAKVLMNSVAYRNSPEFLRSGRGSKADVGNLDQGGVAKSWRELPVGLKRALHSIVAPALLGQGYSLCRCFPEDSSQGLKDGVGLDKALSGWTPEGVYIDFRHRGEEEWTGASDVDPSRVDRVRIRPSGRVVPAQVVKRLRPWITDICAAGVKGFDDDSLVRMGRLPAVSRMDLARTSVVSVPGGEAFPSLKMVNVSGSSIDHDAGGRDDVTLVRDY
ncbi:sulfotransferase [Luteimonas lutimaris]|uniref:sulfotransferase n=1 Tax=Luteimonas lutimaris TaxID=698645 RepID=UPI0031E197A0